MRHQWVKHFKSAYWREASVSVFSSLFTCWLRCRYLCRGSIQQCGVTIPASTAKLDQDFFLSRGRRVEARECGVIMLPAAQGVSQVKWQLQTLICGVPKGTKPHNHSDSKVHGANMGPTWGRQDPGGPHVGPINLAIWACISIYNWWCISIIHLRRLSI